MISTVLKKHIRYYFLNLFLFLLCSANYAQRNDAALWADIVLEKRIVPKLTVHFKEAIRVGQNVTQLNYSYSDIGLTFKINKNIQTSLDYRFIRKLQVENYISLRHRVYFTLELKKKLKPFTLNARFIFQSQLEDVYSREKGKIPDYYERTKLTVKYDLNRFTPYLATELYINIIRWEQLLPNRYRLFAGFNYELNKMNGLEIYYLFERQFNQKNPLTNYVVGISYTHQFY